MYQIIGCSFLIILVSLIVVFVTVSFKRKSILSKNNFIGFGVASVLLYSLYITATIYNGTEITFFTVFTYIKKVIDAACFAPDMTLINSISVDEPVYLIDFALASCLLTFTTISSAVTLFGSSVSNFFAYNRVLRHPCDVVVGYSADSAKYAENNKNVVIYSRGITKELMAEVISKGIPIVKKQFGSIFRGRKIKINEHHFIVFADANVNTTELAKQVSAFAEVSSACQYLHIEAPDEAVGAIRKSVHKDGVNLSVMPINKAGLIAKDFVFNHPLSLALYKNGCLKDNGSLINEKHINVVFIGFGNVSRNLFKTFAVQNQFAMTTDEKIVSSPVHYYLLDSDKKRTVNTDITRIGYEFENIVSNGDFGPADKICTVEKAEPSDVYSPEAMKLFENIVGDGLYTEFIVSLTQTYADFAYADHLADYLGDMKYRIFVRNPNGISHMTSHEDRIFSFGETDLIFKHECIVNDGIRLLSQATNSLYLASSGKTNLDAHSWEELPVIERKSNISSAFSIPFKLGLLGLSVAKDSMTKEEYLMHYLMNKSKGYERYFGTSADNVLAFTEHARWNAFYILEGYRPLAKNEFDVVRNDGNVVAVRHKKASDKKHACIAPYYGLDSIIRYKYKLITGHEPSVEEENSKLFIELANIYSYDYMVMDNLYDNMAYVGYGIK